MAIEMELAPKQKRAAGERCCEPVVYPDGLDVLLSARRVGPTGKAYGLDMTDEMLALARRNQAEAGVTNVEWLQGHIEQIPLPDSAVDVASAKIAFVLAHLKG